MKTMKKPQHLVPDILRMRKRAGPIVALIVALAIVPLALAACGGGTSSDGASSSAKAGGDGAVAGGAGSAAKDLLQSRLQAGDPPDTFQAHAGKELTDYIDAGQIEDISALYDEFKIRDVFPADLLDLLTVDGKIYSVPSNIHRANMVWANPNVLK